MDYFAVLPTIETVGLRRLLFFVNHGSRGRQKPPQGYDASSWDELIYSSAVYGHDDQIVSYFNRMKEADQKRFLLEALSGYCDTYHRKAAQVIIKNL